MASLEDKVEKLAYELQNLGIKSNQIYAKLNTLLSEKRKEDGLIDVWREREYYRDFPTCEEEMSGFGKAFRELTDGLDAESIRTIVLAINRMRKIKSSKDQRMSLYTAREEQEYREILEQMNGEILQLEEGCYYYHGYLLPSALFEPCVFVDRCGLGHLEKPERFAEKDIIDAGAFIGDSAIIFSGLTKKRVYAFEPSGDNYEMLQKTIDVKNSLPCGGKIILTHSVDHIIVAGGESGLHRSMRQSGDVEFDKSFYMTETGKEQVRERIVGQTLGIWPCNRVKVGSCRRGEREDGLE